MSEDKDMFDMLDGTYVAAGLLMPTPEIVKESFTYPLYGEDRLLDAKDIERSLKDDKFKTFRKMRAHRVVNQGGIGKCCPSAVISAYHNRRELDGMAEIALADSHLYMNINGGRDGGSQLLHALQYTQTKGIAPVNLRVDGQLTKFPLNTFNRRQVSASLIRAADDAALTFQSFEPYRVPITSYADFKIAVASAIARDHQIIIAVHAGRSFSTLRQGYVTQSSGFGNHAVLLHSGKWVGGEDLVHPDIQNSWGPAKDPLYGRVGGQGWGDDGFGLITMSSLWQCAKTHTFWVFPGSKVNPGSI
jgi:hypothetical protein